MLTVLPVPDTNGLWAQLATVLPAGAGYALTVIGAAHYPRQLVVEEDGADIVQVAVQCEQASSGLVGPDLDLVVVAARDEPALVSVYSSTRPPRPRSCSQWLRLVEVDAADRPVMLLEAVDQGAHAVVP